MGRGLFNQLKNKNTKTKVVLSTSAQIIGQIIGAVIAVIVLKILSNSLGVSNYGIYATALAFVTTFSLLTDVGLSAITGREIAKHPDSSDEIISHNMGLRILLSILMIPVIIGMSFVFYPNGGSQLRLSIVLLTIYLVFDAIRSVSLAYFTAKIRNDIAALVGVVQQIFLLIFCICAAVFSKNVYGFILAYVLSNVAGAILAIAFTRKHVNLVPKANIKIWRITIGMSLSLGIIQIINLLYLKADSILISIINSPTEVGIYGIAYSLVLAFLTLPSFIMTALIPSMATTKNTKELTSIVEKAFSYMVIFACLLAVGGFVIRKDIILAVSSAKYLAAETPFAILCFASAFSYLNNVFGYASVSINRHHKMVFISLGSLILNILLNLFLIRRYSIDGAAWATVICEIIALLFIYIVFIKETSVKMSLMKYCYKPIFAGLIVLILCSQLKFIWETKSAILNTLVASTFVLIIYVFTLFITKGIPAEVSQITTHLMGNKA